MFRRFSSVGIAGGSAATAKTNLRSRKGGSGDGGEKREPARECDLPVNPTAGRRRRTEGKSPQLKFEAFMYSR